MDAHTRPKLHTFARGGPACAEPPRTWNRRVTADAGAEESVTGISTNRVPESPSAWL